MRRTVAGAAVVVAALAAGCSGDGGPVSLSVTTPPASATAGAPPAGTSAPGSSVPGSSAPGTSAPLPAPTGGPQPGGPAQAYRVLVGDWQRARSAFFTGVSAGEVPTVARQRALAGGFLAAQRAFAAGLESTDWPAAARPAVRALLGRLRGQQAAIAAMAGARSRGEFTARLADYGVGTGAENAAVRAVATVLG